LLLDVRQTDRDRTDQEDREADTRPVHVRTQIVVFAGRKQRRSTKLKPSESAVGQG
jgi:hypothetical protein